MAFLSFISCGLQFLGRGVVGRRPKKLQLRAVLDGPAGLSPSVV